MNLTLRTDRTLVRAGARSTRYLHVSFQAPAAPARHDRLPLTVAFVIDRSGSMRGGKLQLAKQATEAAIRMLRPEDRFSVVVYDDRVDVIAPAAHAMAEARCEATRRLAQVEARGSTDLSTGWLRGCEQIAENASSDTIARCLLLSDGHANKGITDRDELAARAGQLRTAHVVTSTFGVGRSFDERLMTAMARSGGGNAYFIERAEQIDDLLTSELGEALEVVARGAMIELDVPAGVHVEVMNDLRSTATLLNHRIELDDLVSGQEISFIVKIDFPEGRVDDQVRMQARLTSKDEAIAGESAIEWTFADEGANERQPRDGSVDRLVAEVDAMRARREAVESNRSGDYDGARRALKGSAERIGRYAGTDREMRRIVESLESESPVVGDAMDAIALKRMHYSSSSALKMRDASGRARRRNGGAQQLRVEEADGHLVVRLEDGRRMLMATGSPISLAETGGISIAGERFDVMRQWDAVTLDAVRREVAASIDGLLGMDVLVRLFWTLDVPLGRLTVSREPMPQHGGRVRCEFVGGIPVIPIRVDGRDAPAFVETAAWLSYMPGSEATGAEPVDTREDFVILPAPLRFRTSLYPRTIRLGGSRVRSDFGVLPAHVPMPATVRDHWIIGAQILAQRAFSFDPARNSLMFEAQSHDLAATGVES